MAGFSLTGYDPGDPIPGIVREIKFAQGDGSGVAPERKVVLLGNKTSAGSETADTLGDAIASSSDCIARFGQRSEIALLYRIYSAIDPDATIHAICSAEGSGSASVDFTFATDATGPSTVKFTVIGETIEIGVETGDTVTTIATNVKNKINAQTHWPVSASNSSGVLTLTAANAGTRHQWHIAQARCSFTKSVGTTVTKGSVSAASTDDDQTNAIAELSATEIYYHVSPKALTSGASATDNGLGEHMAMITAQALPIAGKDQVLIAGCVGTQSQATAVAESLNNALAKVYWSENSDWTPGMIAAHMAAVLRRAQVSHPASNITDAGKATDLPWLLPAPYAKADWPTRTEIKAALNSGVSPIGVTPAGRAFLVRDVTTYSFIGTNATRDYRAREGHIPSAIHYFWSQVAAAYRSQKQPFVADEPAAGQKPIPGVQYPSALRALIAQKITDACTAKEFASGPYLDPSALDAMLASIEVVSTADGLSARARPRAVRHNLKGTFLLEESGPAY